MSPLALALVLYALWVLILLAAILAWRTLLVTSGEFAINAFPSGTEHGSKLYWRLNRAHTNAVEGLPIFATIVLTGLITNQGAGLFTTLAFVALGGRIVQTLAHVAANSASSVGVRFAAQLAQVSAGIGMGGILLSRLS